MRHHVTLIKIQRYCGLREGHCATITAQKTTTLNIGMADKLVIAKYKVFARASAMYAYEEES